MVQSLTQDAPLSPPLEPGQSRFEPPGYDGPRRKMVRTGGVLLARAILDNPGLLEHENSRLFTDPGVRQEVEDRRQRTSRDQPVICEQWDAPLLSPSGTC